MAKDQDFLHRIVETSPNLIYVFDLIENRNIYANNAVFTTLGYTKEEIDAMASTLLYQLVHPEDIPIVEEHHTHMATVPDGTVLEYETRWRRADGEWCWLHGRDVVFARYENGAVIQIMGSAVDITERKRQMAQVQGQVDDARTVNQELERQRLQLAEANAQLQQANAQLTALATSDSLTEVKNHRAFQERLEAEFLRSQRYPEPPSLLLIDVDWFKTYNDTYGHPAGDSLLRSIATTLMECARDTDFVARYGGDEFAIILPETDANGAIILAERIIASVRSLVHAATAVTVSIGITTMTPGTMDKETLVHEADMALYEAKHKGRNRLVHYKTMEIHQERELVESGK